MKIGYLRICQRSQLSCNRIKLKGTHSLHDFLILGFFQPRFCLRLLLGLGLLARTGSEWCLLPGNFKAKAPTLLDVVLEDPMDVATATLSELIDRVDSGTRLGNKKDDNLVLF